jgi:hypothetical protein
VSDCDTFIGIDAPCTVGEVPSFYDAPRSNRVENVMRSVSRADDDDFFGFGVMPFALAYFFYQLLDGCRFDKARCGHVGFLSVCCCV